jgi:transposase
MPLLPIWTARLASVHRHHTLQSESTVPELDHFPSQFMEGSSISVKYLPSETALPELMIRMLLVGYCFGHPLGAAPCEKAYRWFAALDLMAMSPDHSTFSENRLTLTLGAAGMSLFVH